MPESSDLLRAAIADEIGRRGPIPFARFMELCLYHPVHGYYTRGIGGGGGRDYLTSSGIHHAFGVLVARQVEEMWRRAGRPDLFRFVEFGPGEGRFAQDFLEEASRSRSFARALQYHLVEPSPVLTTRQKSRLTGRTPIALWWQSEAGLEESAGGDGCLFANEVLDAFPVHRVVGTVVGPAEIHVAVDAEAPSGFGEIPLPPSTPAIGRFLEQAGVILEEGQEVDLNLAAPCWVTWASGLLSRGYLMIVDYGYEGRELYTPQRRRGTLLAYHHHRFNEDFLMRPGDQDLTAHVDFTAVRRAAEAAGARCLGLVSQARLLLALGAIGLIKNELEEMTVDARIEALRDREAIKELILPGRMGDRFRVMLLSVGDVPRDLTGLSEPWKQGAVSTLSGLPRGGGGRAEGGR